MTDMLNEYDRACAQPVNRDGSSMSPESQRLWNEWAETIARRVAQELIKKNTEMLVKLIGEEMGNDLREANGQFSELEARILQLEEAATKP